jgi:hypothetical protein
LNLHQKNRTAFSLAGAFVCKNDVEKKTLASEVVSQHFELPHAFTAKIQREAKINYERPNLARVLNL